MRQNLPYVSSESMCYKTSWKEKIYTYLLICKAENKIQIIYVSGMEEDLSICFHLFHWFLLKNSINFCSVLLELPTIIL